MEYDKLYCPFCDKYINHQPEVIAKKKQRICLVLKCDSCMRMNYKQIAIIEV